MFTITQHNKMLNYVSPFHGEHRGADAFIQLQNMVAYSEHKKELPLSRPTSRRNAWGLIPAIKS
jgi:hypothetical protein